MERISMSDYMPFISMGLTIVVGIISFFIKRELDAKDRMINSLELRVKAVEDKTARQDVVQEKLNGRIDTVIEILERLEKKLENLHDN